MNISAGPGGGETDDESISVPSAGSGVEVGSANELRERSDANDDEADSLRVIVRFADRDGLGMRDAMLIESESFFFG